jgi:hypothetical protein
VVDRVLKAGGSTANAKNSYSGYVGFSQFMTGSNYVILLGESNARAGLSGVDMSLFSTVCGNP